MNLEKCHGQCYDGASNMKLTAKKILELYPKAIYVHCYGHKLNLGIKDAMEELSVKKYAWYCSGNQQTCWKFTKKTCPIWKS